MNPYAVVWVGRTKAECLNHFIVFGEKHLWTILKSWLDYYHRWRPHQGLGDVPIDTALPPPAPIEDFRLEDVVCHEALGGLLKHYELRGREHRQPLLFIVLPISPAPSKGRKRNHCFSS
jgi:putative transposase